MSGQIKNTVFTVLTPESVRWAAKGSNVPKVLACSRKVLHGNEVSKNDIRSQMSPKKRHKHAVRHMCLLGHFAHRYLYSWSFDHITSFTLTFDGVHAMVRLNKVKFGNKYFRINITPFRHKTYSDFQIQYLFSSTMSRNPRNCYPRNNVALFSLCSAIRSRKPRYIFGMCM